MAQQPEAAGAASAWRRRQLLALLGAGMALPALADTPSRDTLATIHGRIKVVEHHPDYRICVVHHHPDLRVRWVEHHADAPGLWLRVDHHPDFSIQIVEHHADFTVQWVDHHPGLP